MRNIANASQQNDHLFRRRVRTPSKIAVNISLGVITLNSSVYRRGIKIRSAGRLPCPYSSDWIKQFRDGLTGLEEQ
jgi:hypothetical protein